MLQRGFGAVEALAPNLQYIIFPVGTKRYGIHMPERPFKAPFEERIAVCPQTWHEDLFYYNIHGELDPMQEGKTWKFAEVCCGPVSSDLQSSPQQE
ncbi:hypothetical protein F5Y15DRAFT_364172 [Xylariaceae sp. FL0016]|nr:hypothetical protein F5Y15DRAFT_364172 [Xylariaceae sp. FL0016]